MYMYIITIHDIVLELKYPMLCINRSITLSMSHRITDNNQYWYTITYKWKQFINNSTHTLILGIATTISYYCYYFSIIRCSTCTHFPPTFPYNSPLFPYPTSLLLSLPLPITHHSSHTLPLSSSPSLNSPLFSVVKVTSSDCTLLPAVLWAVTHTEYCVSGISPDIIVTLVSLVVYCKGTIHYTCNYMYMYNGYQNTCTYWLV